MRRINTTSKFKRLYGKNIKELSLELKTSTGTVYLRHKAGLLKHLEMADPSEVFKKIDSRIIHLVHNINRRCNNPKDKAYGRYGARGIKNFLSLEDLIYLWKRDKADTLKQPSIDRIDSKGNYTLENCRFIEMTENCSVYTSIKNKHLWR